MTSTKEETPHSPLPLIEILVDKRTRKRLDAEVRLDMVDHMIAALDDLPTATPKAFVLVRAASRALFSALGRVGDGLEERLEGLDGDFVDRNGDSGRGATRACIYT
jgi:hypothetical protein